MIVLLYKEAYLATNKLNISLSSVFKSLLQKYKVVFPEEVSKGLPPSRGIEHQIDFILGSQIPNKPPYRCNPNETKELQQKVKELMDKGLIRESMRPCVVPILLVSKKDGSWCMCVDL